MDDFPSYQPIIESLENGALHQKHENQRKPKMPRVEGQLEQFVIIWLL